MSVVDRIRIREVQTLSNDWYLLKKTTFDFQRRDGVWQTLSRETYDRGNGATILLYAPTGALSSLRGSFAFRPSCRVGETF